MTIYPALCRRCGVAPARRHSGKVEARGCLACNRRQVKASRGGKRQERLSWLSVLDEWRHQPNAPGGVEP